MKALTLFILSATLLLFQPRVVFAQVGTITTFANIITNNIAVDHQGNVYTAAGSYVYKIDSGGAKTIVAGGSTSYGDGSLAILAKLNNATHIAFDASGNMYIADAGDGVVRKVNLSGIISTVAGNHSLGTGYTGDGGNARSARLNCNNVCIDDSGNIFIADQVDYVIRKVDNTGTISTYAGTGVAGYSGDGGPATSAELNYYSYATDGVWGIAADHSGNFYISCNACNYVRKVDKFGIITTFAGNGIRGSSGVGGSAVGANISDPCGLTTDAAGNVYIAERASNVVAIVTDKGILGTVAGNFTTGYSGDGGYATSAKLNSVYDVASDFLGNIYIADAGNSCIRKIAGAYMSDTHLADSFGIFINKMCGGAQFSVVTKTYNPSYTVYFYYAGGSVASSGLSNTFGQTGYASFTHSYANPGTYTIRTAVRNGVTLIDSTTFSFEYKLCNTLSVQYYTDANANCVFDNGDSHLSSPVLTEVDSNHVPIDTLSSTSGFYYTAYGKPGDVYTSK
ncbi:MAG: hypothetical protein H0X33_08790 [Taibaiella sp.]|nr:hypothetical protein [Taibaiella sp.]